MNRVIRRRSTRTLIALSFAVAIASMGIDESAAARRGEGNGMLLHPNENGVYEVAVYKSGVIKLDSAAKRISVGNPGIADILILQNQEIYVVGKALGSTNIAIWDKSGRITASFEVTVTHDLESLKLKLSELLPQEPVQVRSAQERIILSGEVSNVVKMNAAVELAESFLPDCIEPSSNITVTDTTKEVPFVLRQSGGGTNTGIRECKEGRVVNLIQVGGAHQVMLEVKVAEVARKALRRLDSQFKSLGFGKTAGGVITGGGSFPNALTPDGNVVPLLGALNGQDTPIGPPVQLFQPGSTVTGPSMDKGIFFSRLGSDYLVQAFIEASKENGLAKILAEPTLVTLTGQQAQFLSGGEFPIPVPGQLGQVTIKFKEFGVGLKFLPVVLDSGRINMKLNVDVSELTQQNQVLVNVAQTENTFFIPSLTKRSAESTLELADGQTIGIAGLISDNTRAVVDRIPAIGDIPVLGALFSSQEFLSGQTELVIFVTPHLARPIAPERVRLPTDNYLTPDDMEFFLLGRLEGQKKSAAKNASAASKTNLSARSANSSFGHSF